MSSVGINRYIMREVLSPTLLCLLIFTMVLLVGRLMKLVELVVNKGVAIGDILILFGTMLPAFLNITLPLSFLMGIMIGLSRMSADSETVALKAAGIGMAQIARPVVALALVVSLLTAIAGLWLKPWGYQAFRSQVFAITMQKASIGLQQQVFIDHFDNLVLYASQLDSRSGEMRDLFIVENQPEAAMLIFAERGRIISDQSTETVAFHLEDGSIHRQHDDPESTYQLIHFRNYNVQPNLTSDQTAASLPNSTNARPKEMPTGKLWQQLSEAVADSDPSRVHAMRAELHSRLVTPLAPVLFALFGLPFSIQSHRSGRSGGFALGLVIYLCYYFLLSLAKTLSADAGMPPWLTYWLPQGLLFALGLYCLRLSTLEHPIQLVTRIEQTFLFLAKRLNPSP